jgi:AhpD family alkylhydroperoxidase
VPRALRELVRLRASQLNGCAYCVDLHSRDARAAGAGGQRVDALPVWRESALFDAGERAALDLAEHVTSMSETGVPDHVVTAAVEHLGPDVTAAVLSLVATVNVWNAVGVTTRCWATPPRADA